MDSLQINTGEIRLAINNDPARVLVFNPSSSMFAEKFYRLMSDFRRTLTEYQAEISELEKNTAIDADGMPVNVSDRLAVVNNANLYVRKQIDLLFVDGTSAMVFGDAMVLDAYAQFFEGITPYIKNARADKISKYTPKRRK